MISPKADVGEQDEAVKNKRGWDFLAKSLVSLVQAAVCFFCSQDAWVFSSGFNIVGSCLDRLVVRDKTLIN